MPSISSLSKPVKTISTAQLQILLARIRGAKPITITAFVDARLKKKDANKVPNPFIEARKLSRVNAMTGCRYEDSVNRQRDREGTEPAFEAQERSWGERVAPALVEKDGNWYLALHVRATTKPLYFTKTQEGAPFKLTPKDKLEPFMPAQKDVGAAQGVEAEIIYRNYALPNIAAVSLDGEQYRIRH